MRDPSFISAAAQTMFSLYVGSVLSRGAVTRARRALGRSLLVHALYAGLIAALYSSGDPWVVAVLEVVAVTVGTLATLELVGFALWYARGADPTLGTHRPRGLFAGAGLVVAVLFGKGLTLAWSGVTDSWALSAMLVVALSFLVTCAIGFGVAWRRGVIGSRGFFIATLWPLAPVLLTLTNNLGLVIPMDAFRLIRDLCMLVFEFSLLTSYLDDGHEPMSLRDRIVSSVLMAVFGLATIVAHLVVPVAAPTTEAAGFFVAHAAAFRLMAAMIVACVVVIRFAPAIFRKSVLGPLDRLTSALAEVERGGHVELPVERKDELGRVARSFNTMVGALAEGREALAEKLRQLESRQHEIEGLNDELRRQIAARSRQLADALKDVDRDVRPIKPGVTVDGRYLVGAPLGAGGMGIVYGATRMNDGHELALKVILGSSAEDAVRFMREAEIAATLAHPNLVSVIDVGMHHGTPYFVMERLSGGSLADQASRFGEMDYVLPILQQVAEGILALHGRGILHRDLKPANVLLDGDPAQPVARIGDFGIARGGVDPALAATAELRDMQPVEALSATQAGQVLGTLPYMAPELADGAQAFGDPSDVFAFGVLGCEVCTGVLPFSTPAVMTRMSGAEPQRPKIGATSAPAEIVELLERCLSGEPKTRPTVAEIVATLASAVRPSKAISAAPSA